MQVSLDAKLPDGVITGVTEAEHRAERQHRRRIRREDVELQVSREAPVFVLQFAVPTTQVDAVPDRTLNLTRCQPLSLYSKPGL